MYVLRPAPTSADSETLGGSSHLKSHKPLQVRLPLRASGLEVDGRDRTLVWDEVGLKTKPALTRSCLGHITQMFPASVPSLEKWENDYFLNKAILMLMVIYLKGLGYIYI